MPRTAITVQTPKGPYPGTVNANDLDLAWQAADVANGNYFVGTGRELLLVRNGDAGAQTFTITSAPDPYKRTGNITAYSLGASEMAHFWLGGNLVGWYQAGNQVYLDASDADVAYAVIRIP